MDYSRRAHVALLIALSALFGVGIAIAAGLPAQPPAQLDASRRIAPDAAIAAQAFNPDPPTATVKLIFIHHSTGAHWLDNGDGALLQALNDTNYYVSDASSGGPFNIGARTDIGDWYEWFVGPTSGDITTWLYNLDNTRSNAIPNPDDARENEIVLVKSCFPNSDIYGNPDDPPNMDANPPRGFAPATPTHNVANIKRIYIDILDYFETRQDKLFVVIVAPPLRSASTTAEHAANARAISEWLMHDWLAGYPYHNVAVFNFYNVLTTNGGNADTNDVGLSTGNHHRLITTTVPITIQNKIDGDDDPDPNYLEYPTLDGANDHPSPAGNRKATAEFVPLLNVYYNCWKQGECGTAGSDAITVTAVTSVVSVPVGSTAVYTLSVTASAGVSAPVTLTLQGAPAAATIAFAPNPVTPPGSSTLRITTTSETLAGTYAMTVTGESGMLTDSVTLTLVLTSTAIAPDFGVTVSPASRIATSGQSVTYTVGITAAGGFSQPVTLSAAGVPAGAGTSWSINPVTPPGSSTLRITTSETLAGTYAMTVTGQSGMLTDSVTLTLVVTPTAIAPDFGMTVSPASRIATSGQSVSYTVGITAAGGFSQPVTLSAAGVPAAASTTWSVNPVAPPGSSTLLVTTVAETPAGVYGMTIAGHSATLTDTATLTLIVTSVTPSYTMTVTPASRETAPGHNVTYTIVITGSGGFHQPVTLSVVGVPAGVNTNWNVNPITPDGSSRLALAVTGATPLGRYPIQIVGAAGTQVVAHAVQLIVDYPFKVYLPLVRK